MATETIDVRELIRASRSYLAHHPCTHALGCDASLPRVLSQIDEKLAKRQEEIFGTEDQAYADLTAD